VIPSKIDLWEETFTDETDYGTKWMSTSEILRRSSNTGPITWAGELEEPTFYQYLKDFGFGQSTGLGFPGESPGILDSVETWPGTHYATIALGQSIGVTPMQMLAAYNVIANDGVYLNPRLVKSIGGEPTYPTQERQVIEPEIADDMAEMLAGVVSGGTASRAQVPGYNIAAKTGTARKIQESGGYVDSAGYFHYIATVAGFFPAEDPQLSMIVVIDEPATDIYASQVAAPLFGELAAWSLRHYRVSPAGDVVFGSGDDLSAVGPSAATAPDGAGD
jgi:cell division protein FtsI (penicillin-binding protein 3)